MEAPAALVARRSRRLYALVGMLAANAAFAYGSTALPWATGSTRAQTLGGVLSGDPGAYTANVTLSADGAAQMAHIGTFAGLPLPVAAIIAVIALAAVGALARLWVAPVIALVFGVPFAYAQLAAVAARLTVANGGVWTPDAGYARCQLALTLAAISCVVVATQTFVVRRAELAAWRAAQVAAGKPVPPTLLDTFSGVVTGRLGLLRTPNDKAAPAKP